VDGIPVYDTVHEACAEHAIELTVVFVGGAHFLAAVRESIAARIATIVCMAEVVPHLDVLQATSEALTAGVRLIGPNTNGLMSPGHAKVGFFPKELDLPGSVGVISRSGTLSYAALLALQARGIGQSTIVGIGGSAARGYSMVDALTDFALDDETTAIVLLGEIGGSEEQAAASLISSPSWRKPVSALVVGSSAPTQIAMGHAGALISDHASTWAAKVQALEAGGAIVVNTLEELAVAVAG
jgi:succinyl-CoA synthetase alpha subunit